MNQHIKAFLAIAGTVLVTSAVANATAISAAGTDDTTTSGDLLLVVAGNSSSAGGNIDLTFDLGKVTTSGANVLSISSNFSSTVLAANLNAYFGSTWYTGGTLTWGIVAATTNSAATTIWASSPTSGAGGTAPAQGSDTGANLNSNTGQYIRNVYTQISTAPSVTAGSGGTANTSAAAVLQSNSKSYTTEENVNGSFGLGTIDGELGGSSPTVLDIYKLAGSSLGGTSTLLGYFTMTSSGPSQATTTFTAVPEPSTYAMLGMGALGILFLARRGRRLTHAS